MKKKWCLLLALLVVTSAMGVARSESVVIKGSDLIYDCYIYYSGSKNDIATLNIKEYSSLTSTYDYRAFIRVNLSSIPAGVTIDSARLNLHVNTIANTKATWIDLFKMDSFTTDITNTTYDGTNAWPNYAGIFDGVDGYRRNPSDRRLASEPADLDLLGNWAVFSSDALTQYVQAQYENTDDQYAYFQVTWNDSAASGYLKFDSTGATDQTLIPFVEITYNSIGQTAAPVFTPQSEIKEATDVTITSATEGAKIYYTTDGTYPSTKSTLYTGPVTINPVGLVDGITLNAVAVADGYSFSSMTSYTYKCPPVTIESRTGRIETQYNSQGLDLAMQCGSIHIDGTKYTTLVLSGTVTNWTGYLDSSTWVGDYGFITLLGTDYFVNRVVPANVDETMGTDVFSYLGDEAYGSTLYQMGYEANAGMVLWKNDVDVTSAFEADDTQSAYTGLGRNILADPTQFEFQITYNLTAKTETVKVRDVGDTDWDATASHSIGTRMGSGTDDYSDLVFAVQIFNDFPADTSMTSVYGFDYTIKIQMPFKPNVDGDANLDGSVDVGDLGILAANYGKTANATWSQGDFNNDGSVDVGDLGILAANYGTGTSSGANFEADYAKVFGTAAETSTSDDTSDSICSSLGLSLIAGLFLMGLMIVKMEE